MIRNHSTSIIMLTIAFVILLSACSGISQSEYDTVVTERDTLQAEVESLQAELELYKSKANSVSVSAINGDPVSSNSKDNSTQKIEVGETVVTANYEITFLDFFTTQTHNNNHQTPTNGFTFGIVAIEVKNITTSEKEIRTRQDFTYYADNIKYEFALAVNYDSGPSLNGYKNLGYEFTISPNRSARGFVACEIPRDFETLEIEFDGVVLEGHAHPQNLTTEQADNIYTFLLDYAMENGIVSESQTNIYTATLHTDMPIQSEYQHIIGVSYHADEERIYLVNSYVKGNGDILGLTTIYLSKDMVSPYMADYSLFDLTTSNGSKKTQTATFQINPSTFTRDSLLSPFSIEDGGEEYIIEGFRESATFLIEMVHLCLLEPNGYTYANLGFTQFE